MCNDHDRIETREYYVSGDIDWLLQEHSGWTGLRGICDRKGQDNKNDQLLYIVWKI